MGHGENLGELLSKSAFLGLPARWDSGNHRKSEAAAVLFSLLGLQFLQQFRGILTIARALSGTLSAEEG